MKLVLTALCLLLSSSAFADALPAPEGTCASGSRLSVCHGGSYCFPVTCGGANDDACAAGLECRAVQACMSSLLCGGDVQPDEMEATRTADFKGLCSGSSCAEGTCKPMKLCLPPVTPAPATTPPASTPAATSTPASPAKKSACAGGEASGVIALLVAAALSRRALRGGSGADRAA